VSGQGRWSGECIGEVLPVDEWCNELDDDCDGWTDENFDLASDPDNCGACKKSCDIDNGSGACQDSTCVVTGCIEGWHDANHNPEDGCEYECTPTEPATEICDNQDNDCDGETDGEISGGCGDGDPCTQDLCVAGECANPILDTDEDGFGVDHCGGDDCDDDNPDIHPGQVEQCDIVDRDCDGLAWDVAFCCSNSPADRGFALAVLDQQGQVLFSDLTVKTDLFDSEARIAAIGQDGFIAATKASNDPTYNSQSVFLSFSADGLAGTLALPALPGTSAADVATAPWNPDRVLAAYTEFDRTPATTMAQELDATPGFQGAAFEIGLRTQSTGHAEPRLALVPTADSLLTFGCAVDEDTLNAAWITGPQTVGTPLQLADECPWWGFNGSITWPTNGPQLFLLAWGNTLDGYRLDYFRIDARTTNSVALLDSGQPSGFLDESQPLPVNGEGLLATTPSAPDGLLVAADSDPTRFALLPADLTVHSNVVDAVSLGDGRVAVGVATPYTEAALVIIESTCAR
jgi:hypothetical protein